MKQMVGQLLFSAAVPPQKPPHLSPAKAILIVKTNWKKYLQ